MGEALPQLIRFAEDAIPISESQADPYAGGGTRFTDTRFTDNTATKSYHSAGLTIERMRRRAERGMSREEFDAKLERTEARVQSTLAEIKAEFVAERGELAIFRANVHADNASFREVVGQKLADVPTRGFLVGTVIAAVAVIVGIIGIGVAMFGNGMMSVTSSIDRANQALTVSEQNQTQIQLLTDDIGSVLEEVRALRQQQAPSP